MSATRGRLARRGNYYPTAIKPRGDGRKYAVEPPAPFHTIKAAKRWLDEQGLPGYVQLWQDHTHSRVIVTNRDTDGRYWATNPFTGEKAYEQPQGVDA